MHVTFSLKKAETSMGENLYIIGNRKQFGNWKVSGSVFESVWISLLTHMMVILTWLVAHLLNSKQKVT
jgi:hypothetical protein